MKEKHTRMPFYICNKGMKNDSLKYWASILLYSHQLKINFYYHIYDHSKLFSFLEYRENHKYKETLIDMFNILIISSDWYSS